MFTGVCCRFLHIFKMIPIIRKRSLNPKLHISSSNLETETSAEESSEMRQSSSSLLELSDIVRLQEALKDMPRQTWEKAISDSFMAILDLKKGSLNGQRIACYRECMNTFSMYNLELKKIGEEVSEENSSFLLGLLKRILDQVSKLTQSEKLDELVLEANLVSVIFGNLDCLVSSIERQSTRSERKNVLMRKNSLKKVEQLPAIRPSSRGKLSSLSKKEPLKQEITLIGGRNRPNNHSKSVLQEITVLLCSIVKNISANSKIRRELLQEDCLRLINRYLSIWNEKNISAFGNQILVQLSAAYRHLAVQDRSHKIFLEANCFETWTRLIEMFPTNNDVIFNILRILSKLSNYQSCCEKLNERKLCIKNLSGFFKFYKAHIHIIIRVAFIFANMTSYLADIRNQLFFHFGVWPDIFTCFDHYATSQLSGKNEMDKMGISMAAWDYQAIKKQSDIEAIIKIIRLIANLFTVSAIGLAIYTEHAQSYKELIKKLKHLLQRKADLDKSPELATCILSCLTNVLFYDRQSLMSNPEHNAVKLQLIHVLIDFVAQIDNQEICCESLRVVSNLARSKELIQAIVQAKIHEAALILMNSTSKQIVYYSLGILINMVGDNDFKQQYKEQIIVGVVGILNECENDDFDVVTVALKTLAGVIDNRNENIDPATLGGIESCLMNLGSHCDRVMMAGKAGQVQESRSLINTLLNSMPDEKFICPVKNCGRKFPDDAKLQDHVKRRHKLA